MFENLRECRVCKEKRMQIGCGETILSKNKESRIDKVFRGSTQLLRIFLGWLLRFSRILGIRW